MKLRPILSENIPHRQQRMYNSRPGVSGSAFISMQTSSGCIDKCVGGTTAAQCSQCALNDIACWEECAGGSAAQCVARCNRTTQAQYQNL